MYLIIVFFLQNIHLKKLLRKTLDIYQDKIPLVPINNKEAILVDNTMVIIVLMKVKSK